MKGSPKKQKVLIFSRVPRHITSLVLFDCGLTFIPDVLLECTWLKKLDLSRNQLTVLPEAVGNWTSLKSITLPKDMKCPRNAKGFIEYYSSRLRRKKEAALLYWALKKVGLPRDLANLGRKAVWAQSGV